VRMSHKRLTRGKSKQGRHPRKHHLDQFQMGDLSLLDAVESGVFSLSSADSWLT